MPDNPWADWNPQASGGASNATVPPEVSESPTGSESVSGQYISPYANRSAEPSKFLENLGSDVKDIGSTVSAVGSVPFLRAYELASGQRPANKVIEGKDIDQMGQAIAGIPKYYWHDYLEPMFSNPDPHRSVLEEHFMKAPLATAMDLGIPTGTKALGKAALKSGIPGKAFNAAADVTGKVINKVAPDSFKDFYNEHIAPKVAEGKVNGTPEAKEVHEYIKGQLGAIDAKRQHDFNDMAAKLDRSWHDISPEYQKLMTAVSEHTVDENLGSLREVPKVRKFIDLSNQLNRQVENTFQIPEDINLRQRYGPAYLKKLKDANPSDATTFQDLRSPEHMQALQKLKDELTASGDVPTHNPIVTPGLLTSAMYAAKNRTLGGINKNETSALAKEVAKTGKINYDNPENLPGFLRERTGPLKEQNLGPQYPNPIINTIRDPKHVQDMNQLQQLQLARLTNFEAVRDFVKSMLDRKAEPGWEKVDLKGLLRNIVGADTEDLDRFFKDSSAPTGKVAMPPKTAKMVKEVLQGKGDWWWPLKFIEKWVNHPVRMLRFTLDPVFGLHLAMQTAAVQAWKVKTPKEALTLLISHVLAAHPDAARAIPEAVMLTHADTALSPALLKAGINFQKLLHWKSQFDYGIHNAQRRAVALNFLLYTMKDAPHGLKQAFADVLNVQAALEKARALTYSPEALTALQKDLKPYFGDYSGEVNRTNIRRILKWNFVAGAWIPHALWLVSTMPEHPLKSALGRIFAQMLAQDLQKKEKPTSREYGFIPMNKTGSSGHPKIFKGPQMSVLDAGLATLTTAANMLFSPGDNTEIPSTYQPLTQLGLELIPPGARKDVSTGKMMLDENPDLVDAKYGAYKDSKTQKYMKRDSNELNKYGYPPLLSRAAEIAAPKQYKPIQTLSTMDVSGQLYQPTPFTYPGKPARKVFKKHPVKSDWEDFGLKQIGIQTREE